MRTLLSTLIGSWISRLLLVGFLAGSFHADEIVTWVTDFESGAVNALTSEMNNVFPSASDQDADSKSAPAQMQFKTPLSHFSGFEIREFVFTPLINVCEIAPLPTKDATLFTLLFSIWQPPRV